MAARCVRARVGVRVADDQGILSDETQSKRKLSIHAGFRSCDPNELTK